jgi:hypothetical protein
MREIVRAVAAWLAVGIVVVVCALLEERYPGWPMLGVAAGLSYGIGRLRSTTPTHERRVLEPPRHGQQMVASAVTPPPPDDPPPSRDADVHPESYCGRCGGPNIVWTAPSPLWNAVIRGGSINGDEIYGVVCPTCFAVLAEHAGIARGWQLHARKVMVPLETVTPSGRVWNEKTWMFDDPPDGTP